MSDLPAIVAIIRHGEKPADDSNPHLSDQGRARAAMLARTLPDIYPKLSALFACAPSKDSDRPYETIEPLAKVLGLTIDNSFADHQHAELAQKILEGSKSYSGKTILICWHHEQIPALARDDFGQASAPAQWSGHVFDQIWQIDYSAAGQPTFTIKAEPPMPPA
jgi:phosphohistidine phosphatase SixA